ncbi:MAG: hypothetical protein ACJ74M_04755 [Gaiellaceae bacterium]|jgi:hypothetical protein
MHISMRTLAGLAAIAAAGALVLVPAGSAATMVDPSTYTDPAGDAKSAPDITNVEVALDPGSGALVFAIDLGADDQLAGQGAVFIPLDTDRNSGTGDRTGAEYLVAVFGEGAGILKWNGSDMVPFNHAPMLVSKSARNITVGFCACDIGTQTFDFAVVSARGNDVDVAPDAGGTFPPPAETITIQSFIYTPKPLFPKAGKRFTLKPLGIRLAETNEVVVPDTLSCTAKLGAKKLKGSGGGGCSWLIPKKTRGKKLVVTVNVAYRGETETFSQTYKVT